MADINSPTNLRLIKRTNNHYEVLKPINENPDASRLQDWHNIGRKYNERGIVNLIKGQDNYQFYYHPSSLEEEIKGIMNKI